MCINTAGEQHLSASVHVTKEEVHAKIKRAIGLHKDLLTTIKKQRDTNCNGMVMPPIHQIWPKPSCKHSERGKKTRQTEEEVGRQHQGMDGPGVHKDQEGSEEKGKMKKTGCEIICGAQTTLVVKE